MIGLDKYKGTSIAKAFGEGADGSFEKIRQQYPEGTVRQHGSRRVIKVNGKWVPLSEGAEKEEEEQPAQSAQGEDQGEAPFQQKPQEEDDGDSLKYGNEYATSLGRVTDDLQNTYREIASSQEFESKKDFNSAVNEIQLSEEQAASIQDFETEHGAVALAVAELNSRNKVAAENDLLDAEDYEEWYDNLIDGGALMLLDEIDPNELDLEAPEDDIYKQIKDQVDDVFEQSSLIGGFSEWVDAADEIDDVGFSSNDAQSDVDQDALEDIVDRALDRALQKEAEGEI